MTHIPKTWRRTLIGGTKVSLGAIAGAIVVMTTSAQALPAANGTKTTKAPGPAPTAQATPTTPEKMPTDLREALRNGQLIIGMRMR